MTNNNPNRKVFYVDIGNMPLDEARAIIAQFKEQMK